MEISPNLVAQFILNMVAFLFSASVHESAHAWMSSRFGDDLARSQGRISLNPLVHIDPIGTLLFPAIAFFTHVPLIGWAKSMQFHHGDCGRHRDSVALQLRNC